MKIKLAIIAPLLVATSLAAETHSRLLTRAEIAAAIQKSLDANGFSAGPALFPEDIGIMSPIVVTEAHPRLSVTRIESRPGSNTTQIALWTTSEPRIPPFWVRVDRKLEPLAPKAKAADDLAPNHANPTEIRYIPRAPIRPRSIARENPANESPLIRAGNPIQLIVQGAGMRITTKAKALETGRAGQQIRVQAEPAGKTLIAKIITAQTAEIDY